MSSTLSRESSQKFNRSKDNANRHEFLTEHRARILAKFNRNLSSVIVPFLRALFLYHDYFQNNSVFKFYEKKQVSQALTNIKAP